MNVHKSTITVVVNGKPYEVEYNENEPLNALIPRALKASGSAGRDGEDWQIKFNGTPLDLKTKIKEFTFAPGAVLFLSLEAGVLG